MARFRNCGGRMKLEEGVFPAIFVLSAFLFGILFGCTEGRKYKRNEVLIERCEQTNGRYDFCKKKIETKEYYIIKELEK